MKLLKFEKDNCPGCTMSAQFMSSISFDETKIDVKRPYDKAEDAELAGKYGVMSLPTFLVLDDNGEVVKRMDGYNPAKAGELKEILDLV